MNQAIPYINGRIMAKNIISNVVKKKRYIKRYLLVKLPLDGEKRELANYFDYDKSFAISYDNQSKDDFIFNTFPSNKRSTPENVVKSFLNASDQEYKIALQEKIEKILPLSNIWQKVETKISFPVP